jgi:hypothetical protein
MESDVDTMALLVVTVPTQTDSAPEQRLDAYQQAKPARLTEFSWGCSESVTSYAISCPTRQH